MDNRTQITAGAFYCGLFCLPFHVLFLTFQFRLDPLPTLPALPLFAALAAVYLLCVLLLRRGIPLPALAACALLALAGVEVLVLRLAVLPGVGSGVFAGLIVAAGWGLCLYTAFRPVTVPRLLTQCDVIVLCTIWAALIHEGGTLPADQLIPYPAGLLVNLACLLALRTFGESREVVYGSRLGGALLSVGLLGVIGALLYLFVRFLAGGARSAMAAVLSGALGLLNGLWGLIDRFFTWLSSLFPPLEQEGAPPPAESMGAVSGEEELSQVVLDPRLLIALGIVAAVLAVGVLVFLLIRMRRVRLHLDVAAPARRQVRRTGNAGALGRWLAGLLFRLKFALLLTLRRGSPMGTLVWLERWGRRHHAPRAPGETYRSYFLRLLPLADPARRDRLAPLLEQLADCLDARCFGAARPAFSAAGQIRALLRSGGTAASEP